MGSRLRREWRTKSDGVTKIENRAEGTSEVMERDWTRP